MAIVEMKRVSLLAMRADKDRLMTAMQRMGCVEVTDVPEDIKEMTADAPRALSDVNARLSRLSWAIDRLKKYDTAGKTSFGCVPEITQAQADEVSAEEGKYFALVSELEEAEKRLGEMRGDEARALAYYAQLEPWISLNFSRAEIEGTKTVRVFVGVVPAKNYDALLSALHGMPAVLDKVSSVRENLCIYAVAHVSCAADVEKALAEAGFAPENFRQLDEQDTPKDALKKTNKALNDIARERMEIEKRTAQIAESLPQMKILADELSILSARLKTEKHVAETESAFFVTGWAPAALEEKITKRLTALSPVCSVEFRDPLPDEEPPVALHNSRVATPFESVVEGFALPAYRAYDPTAIMAPFYACLFGMMLSDAGYGLIMAVLIPIFIKVKHIKFENAKMLNLLKWGGIATVIWGLIYNTVLGFNPLPKSLWLLDPMTNSLPVMGVCLGVGALHLFTGLGVAAYMNFKRHDPVAAISDQFSWIMLLCGLGMLLLPATAEIGKILAILGAGIILLMAGRERKNPFKRLIKGLSSLYGITSWLSDLLSYMRLFGMGLATGVIGMVFNQLIGMVMGGGVVGMILGSVLFVGCHVFNLAINALGAYVHSCRLQYIEFFGKFYEEGGRPFKPLSTKTRYVSIKQDAA